MHYSTQILALRDQALNEIKKLLEQHGKLTFYSFDRSKELDGGSGAPILYIDPPPFYDNAHFLWIQEIEINNDRIIVTGKIISRTEVYPKKFSLETLTDTTICRIADWLVDHFQRKPAAPSGLTEA